MNSSRNSTHRLLLSVILIIVQVQLLLVITPSSCSLESFVYVGCSQLRYTPSSPYESNVNSILSSLVNSASIANFNTFKTSLPGSSQSDVVYGLYQCRGDLSSSDCRHCVATAVSRFGTYCVGTSGGALQLDGCFIKYDNASFLGTQDKAVVANKCEPSVGYGGSADLLTRRDAVLAYLKDGGGQYFRGGGSGKVQGLVQCVQDLSMGECQDCVSEAIQRLKSQCATSTWGDMFLGKCYARYSDRGYSSGGGRRRPAAPTSRLPVCFSVVVLVIVTMM